jgi:hypothetical protein
LGTVHTVYTAYKNGDDWGMVDYCFNHIRCTNLGDVHLSNVQVHLISFPSPENSSERPLLRKTEPHALPGNAVEIFKKPGNSEEKNSYSTGHFQVHLLGKFFFHSEFWSIKWIPKKIMEFCFIINFTMKIL